MRFWVTVRKLNVTDRRTDGRTDGRGALQYLPSPGLRRRREIKIGHPSLKLTKTFLRYIHGISLGPMRQIFVEFSCLNDSHTNVPDCPGPPRTEIWPIRGQIHVWSGVIRDSPGWSGMVRDTTTEVLKCLKLPGSSVTVRDDTLIRGSPGQSGTVRVATVLAPGRFVVAPCWSGAIRHVLLEIFVKLEDD